MYFVDVGQGDATIVLPPDAGAIVFDCRDAHVVRCLLRQWNVERIQAVIVSHLDDDHIAGVAELLTARDLVVERVYLPIDRPLTEEIGGATKAKELMDLAMSGQSQGSWRTFPSVETSAPIANGANWSIRLIAPSHALALSESRSGTWEGSNRHSAVLRIQMGETVVLVGGDAPLVTWAEVAQEDLGAQVFRIPHHGGALDEAGTPLGWDVRRLYRSVNPATAAVSVGTTNSHGHPVVEWIEPIVLGGEAGLSTDLGGACRMVCTQVTPRCEKLVESTAQEWRSDIVPESLTEALGDHHAEPPWRHLTKKQKRRRSAAKFREVPCAGTIVVRLDDQGNVRVSPSPSAHNNIVDRWAHPLCRPPG